MVDHDRKAIEFLMPKIIVKEEDIQKIVNKYLRQTNVTVKDVKDTLSFKRVIEDTLKILAPSRVVEDADIVNVISHLKKSTIINEKTINEAAKKVIDHGAMEDLKFLINRNIRIFRQKNTPEDVEAIIKFGRLSPSSSVEQIRMAVQNYFTSNSRPLEAIDSTELKNIVQKEMVPPVDERDVRSVINKYLSGADPEKPFNIQDVRDVIKSYTVNKNLGGPAETKKQPIPKLPGKKPVIKNPRTPTFFEKVRLKLYRYGIKSLTRGARNWLTDNVQRLSKAPNRQQLVNEGETTTKPVIGKMFMYFYDAKTKADLPYWDKFPLIFVFAVNRTGWYGINLHYLPIPLRIKLFDKLLKYADDKTLDEITKLRLSYRLIKNFAQFPEVRPCIKRYLAKQVRSQLLRIDPKDWETAIFLPVEQFQKVRKETVWRESKQSVATAKRNIPKTRKTRKP